MSHITLSSVDGDHHPHTTLPVEPAERSEGHACGRDADNCKGLSAKLSRRIVCGMRVRGSRTHAAGQLLLLASNFFNSRAERLTTFFLPLKMQAKAPQPSCLFIQREEPIHAQLSTGVGMSPFSYATAKRKKKKKKLALCRRLGKRQDRGIPRCVDFQRPQNRQTNLTLTNNTKYRCISGLSWACRGAHLHVCRCDIRASPSLSALLYRTYFCGARSCCRHGRNAWPNHATIFCMLPPRARARGGVRKHIIIHGFTP